MKRTYVDIIAEYYDNQDEVISDANSFGVRYTDIRKLYRSKNTKRRQRHMQD